MGIWATALDLAGKTPAERNRYVDFLRAASILVVVIGHWLIATAWYVDGELTPGHLLKSHPQYQWLTWIFQVMPIFFIVGGYSNAVSLESARRRGEDYAGWLAVRLNRLIAPLLVLVISWAVIGAIMLSGIVVNNGIVLVDHIGQGRRGGMDPREALIAACGGGLRRILLTAGTTIALIGFYCFLERISTF